MCDAEIGDSDEPRLLDVATGDIREVAGAQALIDFAENPNPHGGGYAFFTDVGSHGVRYGMAGNKLDETGTIDWRTGTRRDASGPSEVDDLDAAGLTRQICAPLQRDPYEGGLMGGTYYAPFLRDGRISLSAPVLSYGERGPTLVLHRCGSRARTVLQRGSGEGEGEAVRPLLGAGIVSWVDRTRGRVWSLTPRAHVIGCGRTYSWAAQVHDGEGGPPDSPRMTTSPTSSSSAGGATRRKRGASNGSHWRAVALVRLPRSDSGSPPATAASRLMPSPARSSTRRRAARPQ